jgi:hypothetical protein
MVVWQPRTRRWSRHTDNVAGSSDAKSKNEATRQWDNSIRRVKFGLCCVLTNNQCIKHKQATIDVGRYPPIDTSPHIGDIDVITTT